MCECVCYCAYFYYVNKLYVHVCVLERAKHSFFALPNPLSCSVMNKICLNQVNRHNLPLARHAAMDMSAWLGNDCKQFKLSHIPGVAGLNCGG